MGQGTLGNEGEGLMGQGTLGNGGGGLMGQGSLASGKGGEDREVSGRIPAHA